jgi:hypothetical protein
MPDHADFCSGLLTLLHDTRGVPYRSCMKCHSVIRSDESLTYTEYATLLKAFQENIVLKQRIGELECLTKL